MSTKRYVECPWCHVTNLRDKLALRGGRCRSCQHHVQSGIDYLARQRQQQRALRTKAERRAARKQQRASADFRTMQRLRRLSTRVSRAKAALTRAWSRVSVAVDEHDLQDVVTAARRLQLADQSLRRAQRALEALREKTPVPPSATDARAIILPDKEDEG